jgi:hypothetical protein
MMSFFENTMFPNEIFVKLFLFHGTKQMFLSDCYVCKRWYQILQNDKVFKLLMIRDFVDPQNQKIQLSNNSHFKHRLKPVMSSSSFNNKL